MGLPLVTKQIAVKGKNAQNQPFICTLLATVTAINIEVSGNISVDAAKSAATKVLRNFTKTNFSKLDK
ncbi:MAG: hypothetical protein A2X79_08650 [Desulfuromonadaceae bacterium GWB2_53_15]|nr:MAG: hypothetical protein A2X79_08650 [Desulfuromonadaceae bacterium GWB2_53_15]